MNPDEFRSIADKVLIRELIDEYSNICTQKAVDRLGDLFVEECTWRTRGIIPREFHGRKAVVEAITGVVEHYPFIFQMPHAPRILLDGDRATATTLMHEMGKIDDQTISWAIAVYHDTLVRTADGWKFQDRLFEGWHRESAPIASGS